VPKVKVPDEKKPRENKNAEVLAYLETHKSEIIKDKEERKLKILPETGEGYWIQLDKKNLSF